MKKKIRLLTAILIASMIITSVPTIAFAEETPPAEDTLTEQVDEETETQHENIEQETDSENENMENDSLDQDLDDETENKESQNLEDDAADGSLEKEAASQKETEDEADDDSDIASAEIFEEPPLEDTLVLEEDVSEDNVIEEESSEDATVFDLGDGMKKAIFYGQCVRFEDEHGNLVDYEPELVEINDSEKQPEDISEGYSYENKAGDSKQYIPDSLSEETPLLLEKDKYQIKMTPLDDDIESSDVNIKREETVNPYEQIEEKDLTAEYAAADDSHSYEYTSLTNGVKESIVLNEKPESNEFRFSLSLTNLIPEVDEDCNVVILKDKVTEEAEAVIERPFMNDATADAYSEDITYSIEETENDDEYILTLTVSRAYLDDEARVYPVTIDPTETWRNDGSLNDVYVINGSYADTNFYDSGIRKMIAGAGSDGTSRTYIQLNNLKGFLTDKYVHSANFTLYEYGDCDANQTVRFNRVTATWSKSTINWSNKPPYYTESSINSFTTTGSRYAAHTVAMTTFVRNIVNGTNTNYGIVMRNVSSDLKYTEFYGSRSTLSSYRPKLVVEYYDKPEAPTSLQTYRYKGGKYTGSIYIPQGNSTYISWQGIKSKNLSQVQYKVVSGDENTPEPTSISSEGVNLTSYRSTGASSASGDKVRISYSASLPAGKYKVYIRGKDAGGMTGNSKYKTIYVDGDTPSVTNVSVSPGTTSSSPSKNTRPSVSWNASDSHFSKLEIYVDGTLAKTVTQSGSKSYTLASGIIRQSGKHTIKLTAYDKAGKTASVTKSYYVDIDAPVISTLTTEPKAEVSSPSNNARPYIVYDFKSATAADFNKVEIYKGETLLTTIYDSASRRYQLPAGTITSLGKQAFTIKAYDTLGNVSSASTEYYFDNHAPVMTNITLSPSSSAITPSIKKTVTVTWDCIETYTDSVSYSFDGTSYTQVKPVPEGNKLTVTHDFNAGDNIIYLKLKDKAGNVSQVFQKHYYYSASTEYVPEIKSAKESYGKRVLLLDSKAADRSKYTYELHRGTTSGFTLSSSTRIVSDLDVTEEMYIDKEILNQGTYYYRIKTVAKGSNTLPANPLSNEISVSNTAAESEFANTLGNKDYLEYLEIGMPTGDISVEKSSGNLLFEQTDMEVSNPQLDYSMARTYQSKAARTSMVGKGWLDSYHKEIYTKGTNIYFADSDGSCLKYVKQSDNTYSCSESKEYKLAVLSNGYTLTGKDKTVLNFNKWGQLVKVSEPNGCTVSYGYENDILKAVTSHSSGNTDKTLALTYGTNGLLKEFTDFTGTKYEYTYSAAKNLTKVKASKGSNYVEYIYSYGSSSGKLETVYDGEGNAYSLQYSSGKVSKVTYPGGESFNLTYGSQSTTVDRKTSSDVLIYSQNMTYDSGTGKVLTSQDPLGKVTTFSYQASNPYLLTSESQAIGYETVQSGLVTIHEVTADVITYEYNSKDDVIRESDSDGNITEYGYNSDGLVTSERITSGGEVLENYSYTYDSKGNMTLSAESISGSEERYAYSAAGRVISESCSENNLAPQVSTTAYIEKGSDENTVTVENTATISAGITTSSSCEYDAMGRVIKSVEGAVTTETTYDFLGRAVSVTTNDNGKVNTVTRVYNGNGTLARESSSSGVTRNYSYDSRNRKISETVSGNGIQTATSTFSYLYGTSGLNIHNGITTVASGFLFIEVAVSPDGQETRRYMDRSGRTLREKTGTLYTDYSYDASDNVISTYSGNTQDSNHSLSVSCYDRKGNCIAEILNPAITSGKYKASNSSSATYTTYDSKGNVSTETDGEDRKTKYNYDNYGRVITVDTAGTQDIFVTYTEVLNSGDAPAAGTKADKILTEITDAESNIKTEAVDSAGNIRAVTDTDSADNFKHISRGIVYDERGRISEKQSGDSGKICYEYEGQTERITAEKTYSAGDTLEQTVNYSYDSLGRISSQSVRKNGSNVVTTAYTYDIEGRKTSESVTYGSDSPAVTSWTYSAEGRITSVAYPSSSGLGTISYVYDDLGRIQSVKKGGQKVRDYVYDSLGRIEKLKDYKTPGSSAFFCKNYSYNSLGLVNSISVTDGSSTTVLESYTYTYDSNLQIENATRHNSLVSGVDETRDYGYDSNDRLIESKVTSGGNVKTVSYSYDSAGNRISMDDDGAVTNYSYNGLNQLTEVSTGEERIVYSYDGAGNQIKEENLTTGEVTENSYSVKGELLGVTISDETGTVLTQTNEYNETGTRISRTENGTKRKFYYADGSLAYAKTGSSLTYANVLSPEGSVIGATLGSTYCTYLKDAQGSTSCILNSSNGVAAAYRYGDFGETTVVTGSNSANEIRYTGALYDRSTKLYYLNARYYDPEIGRFISQDTYRGELEDEGQWHLYAYCANNPINYIDLSGHLIETIIDVASLGYSILEFASKPSWINFGYLSWDIAATFIPFAPGSYIREGAEITLEIAEKTGHFASGTKKYLTIGKYKSLCKCIKNRKKTGIEIHHIIEKRFGALYLKKSSYPSIPSSKELHKKITKRWKNAIPYEKGSNKYKKLTKSQLEKAINDVYYDMPELQQVALDTLNKYWKNKKKSRRRKGH